MGYVIDVFQGSKCVSADEANGTACLIFCMKEDLDISTLTSLPSYEKTVCFLKKFMSSVICLWFVMVFFKGKHCKWTFASKIGEVDI